MTLHPQKFDSTVIPRNAASSLCIIIPLYNEEEILPILRPRLEQLAAAMKLATTWILVDDGSSDGTYRFLMDWAEEDERANVIRLSRNFGQQMASTAGLDFADADATVIIDGDLQDPPELIHEMLERYRQGYDVVYAQRSKRNGETVFKRFTSWAFSWIMARFVNKRMPVNTGDFRLMSRKVVMALRQMREGHRFLRGMISWMGFAQTSVLFERQAREAGTTKYPFRRMFRFAMDGILSFSTLPLRLGIFFGTGLFVVGMGYAIVQAVRKIFLNADLVRGWTSLIILQCLVGGSILIVLGIIGEYIGRIYEEIKERPMYIISDTLNLPVEEKPARVSAARPLALAKRSRR